MPRVRLRPPGERDGDTVDGWLGEAVAAVAGRPAPASRGVSFGIFLDSLAPTQAALVIVRDDAPIGILVVDAARDGLLTIEFLAIAAPERNLGLGAEAVLQLEARHPRRTVAAGVPLANGLAIYFWLRTGYAPLYPAGRRFSLPADRLWLARAPEPAPGR